MKKARAVCAYLALSLGISACGEGELERPAAETANDELEHPAAETANDELGEETASDVVASSSSAAAVPERLQWRAAGTTGECTTARGPLVEVSDYVLPASAQGCSMFSSVSVTIEDEAAFREHFHCPADAVSGIDFDRQRLRVSEVQLGSAAPSSRAGARLVAGVVHLAFSPSNYCSASFPPSSTFFTLLPSGPEDVVDDVCMTVCAWLPQP